MLASQVIVCRTLLPAVSTTTLMTMARHSISAHQTGDEDDDDYGDDTQS